MAVAVSRRPLTAETRDKFQDSPRGICGGPSETGTAFSPIIALTCISYHSPIAPYLFPFISHRRTLWYSWLRHCAISRKVADSFPDDVIGIFHSGRTMALGSTQAACNSNEYQDYFLGVKVDGV